MELEGVRGRWSSGIATRCFVQFSATDMIDVMKGKLEENFRTWESASKRKRHPPHHTLVVGTVLKERVLRCTSAIPTGVIQRSGTAGCFQTSRTTCEGRSLPTGLHRDPPSNSVVKGAHFTTSGPLSGPW